MLTLPPELVAYILHYLDIQSLSKFRRTSKRSNAIVVEFSESIYREFAFNHDYLEELDISSCSPVYGYRKKNITLTKEYDAEELNRAIENTNCGLSSNFNDVKSWEAYVRTRFTIDQNWKSRSFHSVMFEVDYDIWRFKLDSRGRRIVATTSGGDVVAFRPSGCLDFELDTNSQYPHLELSESYFMVASLHSFKVYRRIDRAINHVNDSSYILYNTINVGVDCQATKARFPFFLASSHASQTIYLFNFVEGKLVKSFDYRAESVASGAMISYVDFNNQNIFIGMANNIYSFNIATGQRETNPSLGWPSLQHSIESKWKVQAFHYDSKGNHVVAYVSSLRRESLLVWSARFFGVVQEFSYIFGDDIIEHLVVENGRICFLISFDRFCSLWLLDLKDYQPDQKPPVPNCIISPLPTFSVPGRIEMSNDQIYVPCSANIEARVESDYPGFVTATEMEMEMRWIRIGDEQVWKGFIDDIESKQKITEMWNELSIELDEEFDLDGFIILDFGLRPTRKVANV